MTQDNTLVSPNVSAFLKPGSTLWSAFQTRRSGDTADWTAGMPAGEFRHLFPNRCARVLSSGVRPFARRTSQLALRISYSDLRISHFHSGPRCLLRGDSYPQHFISFLNQPFDFSSALNRRGKFNTLRTVPEHFEPKLRFVA